MFKQITLYFLGKKIVPNTATQAVADPERSQALDKSLPLLTEYHALGFPKFDPTAAYAADDVVFYDRQLWKFNQAHAAGAWNSAHVDSYNLKNDWTTAIVTAISAIRSWAENLFAKVDGYYVTMGVGVADNIKGDKLPVTTGYTLKPTGYDETQPELEFADGQVMMNEIRSRACAWNQLIILDTVTGTSSTIERIQGILFWNVTTTGNNQGIRWDIGRAIAGHKYFIKFDVETTENVTLRIFNNEGGSNGSNVTVNGRKIVSMIMTQITTKSSQRFGVQTRSTAYNGTFKVGNPTAIDLTLLNPTLAAKANLTVKEVEEYLASIKTPKPYYAQNAGTLLGAKMSGWQLRKTPNLLNPTTKQAKLFSYTYTGHDNEYTVTGFSSLTNAALQFTPYNTGVAMSVGYAGDPNPDIVVDSNNRFVIPSAGILEVIASNGDITGDISSVCVVATYDGAKDGQAFLYENDSIEFDSANVYYDNNGVKTQVFEGGVMRSTGNGTNDVHDRLYYDEVAKKWKAYCPVGDVDLGDENTDWNYVNSFANHEYFRVDIADIKKGTSSNVSNIICAKYVAATSSDVYNHVVPFSIGVTGDSNRIMVYDSNLTSVQSFKSANNGVHLFYERETPITHDTLYYKVGEDEYVPMEKVFPNGLKGFCCNWASENLVEQEDDAQGQPQSITPVTTEIFLSDMKELLKTHTAEIAEIREDYVSAKSNQEFTESEQTQARANLGFGNGDIDITPTAGSHNLVTSGGVYDALFSREIVIVTATADTGSVATATVGIYDNNDVLIAEGEGEVTALILYGKTYKVKCSRVYDYLTPTEQTFVASIPSRQVTMQYTYIERDVVTLDQTISDSAQMLSGDIQGDVIKEIRSHSHLYLGTPATQSGDTEGTELLCQLSDEDSRLYHDGTPAALDGSEGDQWMKLPVFWWKIVGVGEAAADGAHNQYRFMFAFAGEPDPLWNKWQGDRNLVGAKEMKVVNGKGRSVSGGQSTGIFTQEQGNAYAAARNLGCQEVTWEWQWMMCILCYAWNGDTNSQKTNGIGSNSYSRTLGVTDQLGMTDTTPAQATSLTSARFWGLEAWWNCKNEWMGNVVMENYVLRITDQNTKQARQVSGFIQCGGTGGWNSRMRIDSNGDFVPLAKAGTETTYYCDWVNSNSGSRVLFRSNINAYAYGGVAYVVADYAPSNASAFCGSRLAFNGVVTEAESVAAYKAALA